MWLPLDSQEPRLPLIGLASVPVPAPAIKRAGSIRLWEEQERQRQEANRRMWAQSRAEFRDENAT